MKRNANSKKWAYWGSYLLLVLLTAVGTIGLFQLPYVRHDSKIEPGYLVDISYASTLRSAKRFSYSYGIDLSHFSSDPGAVFQKFMEKYPWQFCVFLFLFLVAAACLVLLVIGLIQMCRHRLAVGCRLGCICLLLLGVGDFSLISTYLAFERRRKQAGLSSPFGAFPTATAIIGALTLVVGILGLVIFRKRRQPKPVQSSID